MLLAESAVEDVHALIQVDRVRVVLIVPRLGLGLGLGLGLVSMVCDGSLSCLDAPRRGVGPPLPGSAGLPGAARRALRRRTSQAVAVP